MEHDKMNKTLQLTFPIENILQCHSQTAITLSLETFSAITLKGIRRKVPDAAEVKCLPSFHSKDLNILHRKSL
jgi:hypothetical protein